MGALSEINHLHRLPHFKTYLTLVVSPSLIDLVEHESSVANELRVKHSRSSDGERLVNDGLLLHFVGGVRAARRTGRLLAGDAGAKVAVGSFEVGNDAGLQERPRTHIPRLLLHPVQLRLPRVRVQGLEQERLGEGIVLLKADEGDVANTACTPLGG